MFRVVGFPLCFGQCANTMQVRSLLPEEDQLFVKSTVQLWWCRQYCGIRGASEYFVSGGSFKDTATTVY